jgi:hypothetical protein
MHTQRKPRISKAILIGSQHTHPTTHRRILKSLKKRRKHTTWISGKRGLDNKSRYKNSSLRLTGCAGNFLLLSMTMLFSGTSSKGSKTSPECSVSNCHGTSNTNQHLPVSCQATKTRSTPKPPRKMIQTPSRTPAMRSLLQVAAPLR